MRRSYLLEAILLSASFPVELISASYPSSSKYRLRILAISAHHLQEVFLVDILFLLCFFLSLRIWSNSSNNAFTLNGFIKYSFAPSFVAFAPSSALLAVITIIGMFLFQYQLLIHQLF